MALRFMDSFDHYNTNTLALLKWTTWVTNTGSIVAAAGRNGTQAVRIRNSNGATGLRKTIDAQQTWIMGIAYKVDNAATTGTVLAILDAGTIQCDVRLDGSGHFFMTRNGTPIGATGSTVISAGVYYFVEFKVKIDNTVGTADLHINGVSECTFSGDTQNTANATANMVQLGANNSANVNPDIDDVYVCDGTVGAGSNPCNDFLGDCRVECLLPNGNGNYSQFTGSDGNSVDNYLLVDDPNTPDDDSTYVADATVGDIDTYTYPDLTPTSGTVYGVQPVPYVRKTDAGARTVASVARLSGTDAVSADKTLSTTYTYPYDVRETKPGGGDWTVADVNNAEFGLKVTA